MNENKTNINWYPGHMAKTKREMKEKLSFIDLVLEVLDARAPISTRIQDDQDIIKNKPRIFVLTKYDLCDKKVTDKIIDSYKKEGYDVVAVDLVSGKGLKNLFRLCEEFQKKENEKRRKKGLKAKAIRVLVLGAPNVGKSTLINRLVGKKVASVGNRPGVTKNLGWIRIHKNMELLDSPGILWPKLSDQEQARILAILSSIKEEILNKEELALYALKKLTSLYQDKVIERYGVCYQEEIEPILNVIAKKRGCIGKGEMIDYEKVYTIILQDVKNNAFGPVTFDR